MPRNGSGVYSAPSLPGTWNPAQSGGSADPDDFNSLLADIVAAMTQSVSADGQTTITNDMPMSTHKHTGVGNASARTHYAAAGQVQDGSLFYAADSGTADVYVITLSPAIAAYAVGQVFRTLIAHDNATPTPTLAVSGLTAGTIEWPNGSALTPGILKANGIYDIAVAAVSTGTPTFHLMTGTSTVLTTRGDIIVRGASGPQRLALGSSGQVLSSDGTDAKWQNPGAFPSGILAPFGGATPPSGWLFCDGTAVSRTTYANLFTAIGTTFGTGNGTTTFNVPDMNGRVAAGADNMNSSGVSRLGSGPSGGVTGTASVGASGGEKSHALVTGELAAHTHSAGTLAVTIPTTDGTAGAAANLAPATTISSTPISVTGATGSNGSGTAHNNVQPTLVLNYIIST